MVKWNKLECFAPDKFFQVNLIFASKARAHLNEAAFSVQNYGYAQTYTAFKF